MNKINISLIAIANIAIVATSCSSDEITGNTVGKDTEVEMTFIAYQEGLRSDTRTSIDGTSVKWSESGEYVTVWDGLYMNKFTATPKSGNSQATLTGKVSVGTTRWIAVYPHTVGSNCTYYSGSITSLDIPTKQTATPNNFDPDAAVMVAAINSSTSAKFHNVCSFLKLTTTAAFSKIVLSVTSGNLAGKFSVDPSTGVSTVITDQGAKSITLTTSLSYVPAGTYYVAIAPGEVSGLSVKCYNGETLSSSKSKESSVASIFARSSSYDLGSFGVADPNLLPGKFKVSDSKWVQFTKGNLWYGLTQGWYLETNQTTFPTGWDEDHVGHFFWVTNATNSYQSSYILAYPPETTESEGVSDIFFCGEANLYTVDGTSGLYALTEAEMNYLFSTYLSKDVSCRWYRGGVTVATSKGNVQDCFVFAPKDYDYNSIRNKVSYTAEEFAAAEANGLVCLPPVGSRSGSTITQHNHENIDGDNFYWTASTYNYQKSPSFNFGRSIDYGISYTSRNNGSAIRLVKTTDAPPAE